MGACQGYVPVLIVMCSVLLSCACFTRTIAALLYFGGRWSGVGDALPAFGRSFHFRFAPLPAVFFPRTFGPAPRFLVPPFRFGFPALPLLPALPSLQFPLSFSFSLSSYFLSPRLLSLFTNPPTRSADFIKLHPEHIAPDNAMGFMSDDGGETYNKCHCESFLVDLVVLF